jgi:hypothetical protein
MQRPTSPNRQLTGEPSCLVISALTCRVCASIPFDHAAAHNGNDPTVWSLRGEGRRVRHGDLPDWCGRQRARVEHGKPKTANEAAIVGRNNHTKQL